MAPSLPINPDREIFRWGPVPGKYFYVSDFTDAMFGPYVKRFPKHYWVDTLMLFSPNQLVWINDQEAIGIQGKKVFIDLVLDDSSRIKLKKEWKTAVKELHSFYQRLDLSKDIPEKKIAQQWEEFRALMIRFITPTIPPELGNYGSPILLKEKLIPFIPNEKECMHAMEILTAPEELSFYQEEEIALAETNDLKQHQKEYFWLQNSYNGTRILPISFFAERKRKIDPLIGQKMKQKIQRTREEKQKLIKKYHLSPETIKIADVLAECVAWQDERKKHIFILQHYKDLFLRRIESQGVYSWEQLQKFDVSWVSQLLKGEDISPQAKKRADYYGFYGHVDKLEELSTATAKRYWDVYSKEKVTRQMESFSGTVASKGNGVVKGHVHIVLDPLYTSDFKTGEILVAPMTSPEYVFLMKKAAAIITDTGGLTSHAAIVSRELHKPCIIGTKVATQMLKNGEIVEVDPMHGIIHKLKP